MNEKENNTGLKPAVEEKKPLSPQQLQKRKKMVIFPLFFLLFALSMWFIFAPSGEKSEEITRPPDPVVVAKFQGRSLTFHHLFAIIISIYSRALNKLFLVKFLLASYLHPPHTNNPNCNILII